MYTIESNIPIPTSQRGAKEKYPFSKLEVGQSFLVDEEGVKLQNVRTACTYAQKRMEGKKFICRAEDTGVRVWRVE